VGMGIADHLNRFFSGNSHIGLRPSSVSN
jgi:hypothetical protein